MRNTQVLIIGAILTVVVIVVTVFIFSHVNHSQKNMKSEDTIVSIELSNGSKEEATVTQWPEAKVIQYHQPEPNLNKSKVEDVVDALWSTPNRNPDLYLTLLDPGAREQVKKIDKETGGKLLSPSLKNEPFPSDKEIKTSFTHYVELNKNGKRYRVLVGKQVVNGVEYNGLTLTLVFSNGQWLQSFDLDKSTLLTEIGLKSFNDLVKEHRVK
jgi:hypothetical protein